MSTPSPHPVAKRLKLALFALVAIGSLAQAHNRPASSKSELERKGKAVLSGCEYDYPPLCMVSPDSQADGFSVELLRTALGIMGKEVVFKVGPWNTIKQDLSRGNLQVLPLVGRTPERERGFDFTFPYLTMHGAIVVRESETGIRLPADLRGKQVAVMQGDNAEEFVRRSDLGASIVVTSTFADALRQLSEGMHNAVIIQRLVAMQLIRKAGITNLRFAGPPLTGFSQSFCFAVREGDSELLARLNEGLALAMADGTFRRLQAKWFAPLEPGVHGKIVVGGDHNYPPYEYLDRNGNPAGYNIELTRTLAAGLGIDVEIRLGPWASVRKGLASGEIDMMHGIFYSPQRDSTLEFSPPHALVQHVFAVREGSSPPRRVEDLAGMSILVMDQNIMHDLVLDWGLKNQVITTQSQEDALRSLASGKGDCALIAKMPALYWIKRRGWKNLRIQEWPELSAEYCYSVGHGNAKLLSRFEAALLEAKNSGDYRRIYTKWFGVYEGARLDLRRWVRYALYAAGVALLLLAISMIWSRILRKRVIERTAKLQDEISERKRAEDALAAEKALVDAALFSQQDTFFVFDPQTGKARRWNESFARISGYSHAEIAQLKAPDSYYSGADLVRAGEAVKKLMQGEYVTLEMALVTKDGTRIPTEYTASTLDAGEPVRKYIVAVGRDIRERISGEEERGKLEDQLRQSQKLEAIGQLAGGIAHDFNNQLGGIVGHAELLRHKVEGRPDLVRHTDNIIRGSMNASRLTDQLLAFARRGKYLNASVNIHKSIAEVVSILEHSIDKRIAIKQFLEATPPTIMGDPSQIQNVLLNIAINARDSMPEGGTITFSTRLQSEGGEGRPGKLPAGDYLVVSIADTGTGIEEGVKDRIFEPFFTTKGVGRGTGMGLASVYGAVENHKGAITLDTTPGVGTAFHIWLPAVHRLNEGPPKAGGEETPNGFLARILLVDDEEEIRSIASEMLRDLGYKVVSCTNGKEAVEYYRKFHAHVDLVILDMMMPELNGRDAFFAMQEISPEVRAILCSGYSLDRETKVLLEAGAVSFLQKPFRSVALAKAVSKALQPDMKEKA